MATWGEILSALQVAIQDGDSSPHDRIRRETLVSLHQLTGRQVILYATHWTAPGQDIPPGLVSIVEEDVQAFMEVVHGLDGREVDLILHTPGGSIEATEMIVRYLRSKFDHIRLIVPQAAMSAGTLLACAADEVLMGRHSSLGPIDPQFILQTKVGPQAVPAFAIRQQFAQAVEECRDPGRLGAWAPMLEQYGPGLLVECESAIALSEELASTWLARWMFKRRKEKERKAREVAADLADYRSHRSHGRHLTIEDVRRLGGVGLKVTPLEADQDLQDAVLSVFHATTHTLSGTPALKIVENHRGKAFVKMQRVVQIVAEE